MPNQTSLSVLQLGGATLAVIAATTVGYFVGNIQTTGTILSQNITATGAIVGNSLSGATFYGSGLGSCNGSTSKILYNNTTNKFECGVDQTGAGGGMIYAVASNIFVNKGGATMTGALTINLSSGYLGLKVLQTASGDSIHAEKGLSSSGTLAWEGTATGKTLNVMGDSYFLGKLGIGKTAPDYALDVVGTLRLKNAPYTGANTGISISHNAAGANDYGFLFLKNGTNFLDMDTDLSTYVTIYSMIGDLRMGGNSATTALTLQATSRNVGINRTSPSTKLDVLGTISGTVLHVRDTLASSGALVWEGTASGKTLTVMNGSYFLGTLGIGVTSPKTRLEVVGAMSGTRLVVSLNANISGALLVVGNAISRGTLSGTSLGIATGTSNPILGDSTSLRFQTASGKTIRASSFTGSSLIINKLGAGSGKVMIYGYAGSFICLRDGTTKKIVQIWVKNGVLTVNGGDSTYCPQL